MKSLKISTLLIALSLTMGFNNLKAQDYTTGIGIRGGLYNGLTIKSFMSSRTALEAIITTRWRGFNAALLIENHSNTEGVRFYYGAGGHIGLWNNNDNPYYNRNGRYSVIGVDGIVGVEINFDPFPLNFSLDWKPSYNLSPSSSFWYDEFALSARFIF